MKTDQGLVIVFVYADDLLITGSNATLIQETRHYLHQCFKIKDLWDLKYLEFSRSKKTILMHQTKYVIELISDLGFTGAKPFQEPMEVNKKVTSLDFDKRLQDDSVQLLSDLGDCKRLIWRLLYLTITRPNITFAIQFLSEYMHSPKVSLMFAAIKVIK